MQPPEQIAFIALWSRELATQRRFFVDVMGFDVVDETEHSVVLTGSQTTLVLKRAYGQTGHLDGQTHLGYFVDDLDGWVSYLASCGAVVRSERTEVGGGRRAVVIQAPGGHHFALVGP